MKEINKIIYDELLDSYEGGEGFSVNVYLDGEYELVITLPTLSLQINISDDQFSDDKLYECEVTSNNDSIDYDDMRIIQNFIQSLDEIGLNKVE